MKADVKNRIARTRETWQGLNRYPYFRALMKQAGILEANLGYEPSDEAPKQRENTGFGGWLTSLIPSGTSEKMAAKSVRRFSERIGHSMEYTLNWK